MSKQKNNKLFDKFKNTNVDDLRKAVEDEEGVAGNVIVQHSKRIIKYMNVSESELDDLGRLDLGTNFFVSISAFFLALWFDIFKDKKLSESIPSDVQATLVYVEPALIILSGLFFIFGIGLYVIKRIKINTIKKESIYFDQS